jgi:hypothetical protein
MDSVAPRDGQRPPGTGSFEPSAAPLTALRKPATRWKWLTVAATGGDVGSNHAELFGQFPAPAVRTGRFLITPNQQFALLVTRSAGIFVKWHDMFTP